MLPSPPSTAAGGLDFISQDMVFLWTARGSINFLLKRLSAMAVKIFV